ANIELWPFVLRDMHQPLADAVASLLSDSPPTSATDRNRVDCQTAATIVLLDSLLTADTPENLLTWCARNGCDYLCVYDPDSSMRVDTKEIIGGLRVLSADVSAGSNVDIGIIPPGRLSDPFNASLVGSTGSEQALITPSKPSYRAV